MLSIEQDIWIGLLHHTVNEHKWVLGDGKGEGQCGHDELGTEERQKPWLSKNTKAHDALREIILKKRFLNTIPYYVHFRYVKFIFCVTVAHKYMLYNNKIIFHNFVGTLVSWNHFTITF